MTFIIVVLLHFKHKQHIKISVFCSKSLIFINMERVLPLLKLALKSWKKIEKNYFQFFQFHFFLDTNLMNLVQGLHRLKFVVKS